MNKYKQEKQKILVSMCLDIMCHCKCILNINCLSYTFGEIFLTKWCEEKETNDGKGKNMRREPILNTTLYHNLQKLNL